MNKRNMVRLVVLAALLMACLAGCGGQKYIGIQTLLTLEQDNTGNRQIRMSIGKSDFETFFDGKIDELNKQLEAVCPPELEWSFSEDGDQYGYTFTLHFSSLKDYAEKVKNIIGKKASIVMEQPDSVFASGLLYQEDFDSLELLGWLGDFLEKEGYLSEGKSAGLFSETSVKISFKGTDYEVQPGKINVDTLVRTPVERIDILSHYRQNKHCDRQVVFTFSAASMNKNGTAIREYMQKNRPEGAESVWTVKNENSLCTVSVSDCTAKQLDSFMKKLFDRSDSFISVQPQQRAGIFASAADWSELIDVNAFSYNQNEKVAVGYYIQWEDGMDVSIRHQNEDKPIELIESEMYGGYQKVLEEEMLQESLITEVSTTYVIEDVEIDTEFHDTDNLSRSITLVFQVKPDQEDQENIRKRIAGKTEGIAGVTNGAQREDGRASIVIEQTGSIDDVNAGFQAIFDVQGQLSHELSGELMEFQHDGRFVDLMDFTGFLENDPLLTTLTYHLKMPWGEQILEDTISSTVDLKQGTQDVKNGEYTGSVKGAYLSLTLNSRKWNTDGIMLFLLLMGLVLIAAAVIFFADFLSKVYEYVKNKMRSFNGSFGKNDDMMEDFPEEGGTENSLSALKNKWKKGRTDKKSPPGPARKWKLPPLVEYEEVRFEDMEENGKEPGGEKYPEEENAFNPESLVEKVSEVPMETPETGAWDRDPDEYGSKDRNGEGTGF
ncbi:MAG: hypothetical protein MR966_10175 [Lachnospiraceae bacterium]|nr:hypothetical protein [Lachnospiraceae bacterium]